MQVYRKSTSLLILCNFIFKIWDKSITFVLYFPVNGGFILGFRLAKHSTTQPPNSISIIYTKEQEESPSLLPWYKMDNQTGKSKSICLNLLGLQNNIMKSRWSKELLYWWSASRSWIWKHERTAEFPSTILDKMAIIVMKFTLIFIDLH